MKKFISLGLIDRNIYLPFLLAAFLIFSGYIGGFVPKADYSYYIKGFGTSFGFMLARLIPCIFRIKSEISFKKNCTKSNIKDYFFLLHCLWYIQSSCFNCSFYRI